MHKITKAQLEFSNCLSKNKNCLKKVSLILSLRISLVFSGSQCSAILLKKLDFCLNLRLFSIKKNVLLKIEKKNYKKFSNS